jgi:hypothetical protein
MSRFKLTHYQEIAQLLVRQYVALECLPGFGRRVAPDFILDNEILKHPAMADGFIRKYCPELAIVSDKYIHEPQQMSLREQVGCRIREVYPSPMVDHDSTRKRALAARSDV